MAKVSDYFPVFIGEEEFDESSQSDVDFEAETLDPAPYWSSSVFDDETLISPHPPIFSTAASLHRSDYEDQTTLSLDLFDRCAHPETLDTSDFGVLDGIDSLAPAYLGLGLGLEFDVHEEPDGPLRVVDWGASDSDSDSFPISHGQSPILPPLRWAPHLDDGFEWEEVDVDARLDERDFLSMMVGERSAGSGFEEDDDDEVEEDEEEGEGRNVDWEVLLAVSNVVIDDGDFINPSEYEVLFGQFADHDSAIRGTPPAAKSVVSNLPLIVLTQEDVDKNNATCAVCKDDISLGEKVKQLPCLHHYHGECILPWLGMRNTCPVCRYELPTDDPDYESWKAQRRASNEARYDFENFSEPLV